MADLPGESYYLDNESGKGAVSERHRMVEGQSTDSVSTILLALLLSGQPLCFYFLSPM